MDFPRYETYQDVRKFLTVAGLVLFNIIGFVVVFAVLPPAHQDVVAAAVGKLSNHWIAGGVTGIVVFTVLAYLLVEVLKVHDRVYDRYFVCWRRRYDTDFILQRLLRPFPELLTIPFWTAVDRHKDRVMEVLYYHFVGDYEPKIAKNLLVRFYERVFEYWLTQLVEMTVFLLFTTVVVYSFIGPADPQYLARLLRVVAGCGVVFALNRLWMRHCREGVRAATANEVEAIIQGHDRDLAERLHTIRKELGLAS